MCFDLFEKKKSMSIGSFFHPCPSLALHTIHHVYMNMCFPEFLVLCSTVYASCYDSGFGYLLVYPGSMLVGCH